ncbi:MAG: nucleotidyltransferase domain-containing protein [Candidatus Omnitrophota bacterium]
MESRIPIDMDKIEAFCKKWKVKDFYLFGSVLREDFVPESDVDALVRMSSYSGIGLFEWMDMIEELEAIFNRKVDLLSTDGVRNPFIRREIAQTRRLIYAS